MAEQGGEGSRAAHVAGVLNELPAVISSLFSQAWDRLCESHPSTWSTDVVYTGNARVEQKDILSRGLDLVFRWIASQSSTGHILWANSEQHCWSRELGEVLNGGMLKLTTLLLLLLLF